MPYLSKEFVFLKKPYQEDEENAEIKVSKHKLFRQTQ